MILKNLLIALVAYISQLDERYLGASMMNRPIIIGPVVGLILGDLQKGIVIGAALEAMFIGIVTIGAALPPDVGVASAISTALAIQSGASTNVAVTLAMPFAIVAQGLNMLAFTLNSYTIKKGRDAIKRHNFKSMQRWHFFPLILRLPSGILTFLVLQLGTKAAQSLIALLPTKIMTSFSVAAGLLPAVGFAMLIQMMMDKKVAPYFFIGFILSSYLKMPVIGVSVLALLIALLITQKNNATRNNQQ